MPHEIYCAEDMVALDRWWMARPLNSVVWRIVEYIAAKYGDIYVTTEAREAMNEKALGERVEGV